LKGGGKGKENAKNPLFTRFFLVSWLRGLSFDWIRFLNTYVQEGVEVALDKGRLDLGDELLNIVWKSYILTSGKCLSGFWAYLPIPIEDYLAR
jgi:hypothetical protein